MNMDRSRSIPRAAKCPSVFVLKGSRHEEERNVAVARANYEAYVAKDRRALEPLIADDFHFTSPLDNRINRATYFDRCWPNSERTEGFDFIHVEPDGGHRHPYAARTR